MKPVSYHIEQYILPQGPNHPPVFHEPDPSCAGLAGMLTAGLEQPARMYRKLRIMRKESQEAGNVLLWIEETGTTPDAQELEQDPP